MNKDIAIWGAGLSGLIAAQVFQTATVFDRNPAPSDGGNHKALLRFRSSAVGDACGIDFRKVRVHKGLWCGGRYVEPSILHANNYSLKVLGRLEDRSVWALDPVDRWVAPKDFYEQLIERCGERIVWNYDVAKQVFDSPTISTIPMPALAEMLGEEHAPEFRRSRISVRRWIVPNADVYQTVYVSDPATPCYRVSITGDLMIAEYIESGDGIPKLNPDNFYFQPGDPIGIPVGHLQELPPISQSFGKIAPIDDAWRKDFMYRMTHEHDIYSLGRFGTWRNILLDDVLNDCAVIKRMMSGGSYERKLSAS